MIPPVKRFFNTTPLTYLSLLFFILLTGCATGPVHQIYVPNKEPPPVIPKKVDVALVLGAGGSRAFAHLGVLEVFEEEGIPIDLIVGSSAGSLVGALYADCPHAKSLKRKIIQLKRKDLLDPSLHAFFRAVFLARLTGPVQGVALQRFLLKEMKAKCFHELKIPLVAVATNVDNNHLVMLRGGPIAPAVHASSALPPVFCPVQLYGQTLVDGGVIAPVPVQVARLYKPKYLIAVDISTPPSNSRLETSYELLYRSLHISFYELSRMQSSKADIFLHPDLSGFGTFDDEYNVELYEKGKVAARAAIPDIKKALAERRISLRKRNDPSPVIPVKAGIERLPNGKTKACSGDI